MSYWTRVNGKNALKGVPGDVDNPPNTSDEDIIFALQHSRDARTDFDLVFPSLSPEEQDRLTTLVQDNPARSQLWRTMQSFTDVEQNRRNREGVHTSGPKGGKGVSHGSSPRNF